jgi:hypothetical protein
MALHGLARAVKIRSELGERNLGRAASSGGPCARCMRARTVAATPSLSRSSSPNMNPIASSYPNGTAKPRLVRSSAVFPMNLNPARAQRPRACGRENGARAHR